MPYNYSVGGDGSNGGGDVTGCDINWPFLC